MASPHSSYLTARHALSGASIRPSLSAKRTHSRKAVQMSPRALGPAKEGKLEASLTRLIHIEWPGTLGTGKRL
eukprot:scaffold65855_cov37-Prasinocladus_malaysianus.AAC.1